MNCFKNFAICAALISLMFSGEMKSQEGSVDQETFFNLVQRRKKLNYQFLYHNFYCNCDHPFTFCRPCSELLGKSCQALCKVKRNLEQNPKLLNACDENGNTPLHIVAIDFPDGLVIEHLIKLNAKLNAQNNEGKTVLHILSENRINHNWYWKMKNRFMDATVSLIIKLIKAGANPLIEDKSKKSAIDYADDKLKEALKNWQNRSIEESNPKVALFYQEEKAIPSKIFSFVCR